MSSEVAPLGHKLITLHSWSVRSLCARALPSAEWPLVICKEKTFYWSCSGDLLRYLNFEHKSPNYQNPFVFEWLPARRRARDIISEASDRDPNQGEDESSADKTPLQQSPQATGSAPTIFHFPFQPISVLAVGGSAINSIRFDSID